MNLVRRPGGGRSRVFTSSRQAEGRGQSQEVVVPVTQCGVEVTKTELNRGNFIDAQRGRLVPLSEHASIGKFPFKKMKARNE